MYTLYIQQQAEWANETVWNFTQKKNILHLSRIQGGSNMTGTDLCVNKPHCAAAVRPCESEATTSTLPPARVRTCSVERRSLDRPTYSLVPILSEIFRHYFLWVHKYVRPHKVKQTVAAEPSSHSALLQHSSFLPL